MLNEILTHSSDIKYHTIGEGVEIAVLRNSMETGQFSVLIRMAKGSQFAPHHHLGAGEYIMLKGEMHYRAGIAKAGDYGYEPLGADHDATNVVEDSVLFFIGHGPVAFTDEQGGVKQFLDCEFLEKLSAGGPGATFTAEDGTVAAAE